MLSSSQRLWIPRLAADGLGHVLVADSDELTFAMVRQCTAPDRWRVAYAENAEEVIRILRTVPVTLVIVELSMVDASPDLGGELLERSRRGLRVVVTTAEHSESNERRARLLGPVFYAPKPLNIALLSHVMDGALGAKV